MKTSSKKILIASLLILAAAMFFALDMDRHLTLETLKTRHHEFESFFQENQIMTISVYFLVYAATTALSLPGAAILTLGGGALFGLWTATLLVSFASSTGATLSFLFSRYFFRESIQRRFGDKLKAANEGVQEDGAFYLFTLRLVPVFPFFVINLLMGLTPIRSLTFYWVSQIGMLPGTLVYVNAGTQLSHIESLKGILSPELIFSFVLLGLFPLAAKKFVAVVKSRWTISSNIS